MAPARGLRLPAAVAARLGRECGPAGAVSGAFRRQSLPGGAEGGRRGRRSAPLREREGAERRRLRWRRPSKRGGGAGRGARGESAPAGGAGARPGASSAGSAAEPAAWDMAKAGGAGERGAGRSAGGGREPGPGEPLARWAEAQRPWRPGRDPRAFIRGSALPASFPRPGSPRGTRHHALPAAEGQVCASPVQSGSWELSLPSERPGSRPRHRDPKGDVPWPPIHPTPSYANQDAPPCPVTVYPECDNPPPPLPAGSGDPDSWSDRRRSTPQLGSRPAPHPTWR